MNNKFIMKNKGFTIIETLVAITILMIAVAGPLTIAQKSLMASIYARDQIVASYLAQEVMEEYKNSKKSEWVSTCSIPMPIPPGLVKYTRTCNTQPLGDEEKITVTVTWNTNGVSNSMVLVSSIFNIKL